MNRADLFSSASAVINQPFIRGRYRRTAMSKTTGTRDWMRRLADHYARFRQGYPDDRLLIVFDIVASILDLRYMVRHVLLHYDRDHGSDLFLGPTVDALD